jgi:predicted DNA-binding protein
MREMKFETKVRLTKEQKERLIALAKGSGFNTISSYVRFMIFNPSFDMKLNRILEIVKDLEKKINSNVKSELS